MDCKIPCHLPKQQTGFKKNTQIIMKARLGDDDEVSVWGKKIISQLANFFENQNFLLSGMLSFKSTIPVFCFIRTAHRLRKAKLMVWQNIFICCPNSREDFSPLHGRKLLVSMGWGCNEPSFSDSSCVTGFALPWEWRDDSSTRGSIRVANL